MLGPADRQQLADNLARIRARIGAACARAGRPPDSVALVAVTKYAGPAYARALVELGQRDLGENRVDHLLRLAGALADLSPRPRWHMIGHLQRNKARKVASVLTALHSLDSAELARKLSAARDPALPPLETYVEVRLSAAEQRSGVEGEELPALLRELAGLTGLRLAGLMGLPPEGPPEAARPHFQRLRALAREHAPTGGLSMGMTSDLEVAVEEGATCVRIGRALLDGLPDAALRG